MTEIKRYSQKVSLSTESPNVPASPEAFSASGRLISDIGSALGTVAEHFTAAQEIQQKNEASNLAQQKLQQIRLEAAGDPDPKNTENYIKRIEEVRNESSQGFTLKNAKNSFDTEFNTMANSTHFELMKGYREKVIKDLLSKADQAISIEKTNFIHGDDITAPIAFQGAITKIDELEATGAMTPTDATNQRQKIEKEFPLAKAQNDAYSNPQGFLDAEESGAYKTVEPKQLEGLRTSAERILNKQTIENERLRKIEYEVGMRQSMLDMFDGKLTLSEAQRRYRDDVIKESDYNVLERKMVTPDYELLRKLRFSDPQTFNDIRHDQLDNSKSPGEIDRMIASGNADGKITNEDAKYLVQVNKGLPPDPRDQKIAAQAASVKDFGERYFKQNFFDEMFNKEKKVKDVDAMVTEFYKRIDKEQAQGDRIDQVAHEVIADNVKKKHPEISRLEDIPHIIVEINGRVQRLLNPDQKTKLKAKYKIVPAGNAGNAGNIGNEQNKK